MKINFVFPYINVIYTPFRYEIFKFEQQLILLNALKHYTTDEKSLHLKEYILLAGKVGIRYAGMLSYKLKLFSVGNRNNSLLSNIILQGKCWEEKSTEDAQRPT